MPQDSRASRVGPWHSGPEPPMCSPVKSTIRCQDFVVRPRCGGTGVWVRANSTARYGCRAAVSIAHCLDIIDINDWGNDVAYNIEAVGHRAEPIAALGVERGRHNLRDRLSAPRDPQRLLGFAHLLQQSQALRLEFRDRHFLHICTLPL